MRRVFAVKGEQGFVVNGVDGAVSPVRQLVPVVALLWICCKVREEKGETTSVDEDVEEGGEEML